MILAPPRDRPCRAALVGLLILPLLGLGRLQAQVPAARGPAERREAGRLDKGGMRPAEFPARGPTGPRESGRGVPRLRLVTQTGNSGNVIAGLNASGKQILTAEYIGSDNTAVLWDAESGREILRLIGHDAEITSLAFTSDGGRAVTGSYDGTARLWDLKTGRQLRQFPEVAVGGIAWGHQVGLIAISPDDRWLATSEWGGVHHWDLTTGKEIWSIPAGVGNREDAAVVFSPRSDVLLAFGKKSIDIYEVSDGRKIRSLDKPEGLVKRVIISRDGKSAFWGGDGPIVYRWDLGTGTELRRYLGHRDDVTDISLSPDGQTLASVSYDGRTIVWDIATGGILGELSGPEYAVQSVAFTPDGRSVLIGNSGAASIRDIKSWDERRQFVGRVEFSSVSVSPDGRLLVRQGAEPELECWDLTSGRKRSSIRSAGDVRSFEFSPDSKSLLTCSSDGLVQLWDTETWGESRFIDVGERESSRNFNKIHASFLRAEGRIVVAGSRVIRRVSAIGGDGVYSVFARVFDARTGRELRKFATQVQGDGTRVDCTHDGEKVLATITNRGLTFVWDLATGKPTCVIEHPTLNISDLIVSPDDREVYTAERGLSIRAWRLADGTERRQFVDHTAYVQSLAISEDGTRLLSGGEDGKALLWDVATGAVLDRLDHEGNIRKVMFSTQGKRAVVVGSMGTTRFWDLERVGDRAKRHEPLCSLVAFRDGGWAVTDPEGRYDASNGGDVQGLHWVMDGEPTALDQLKSRYFDPGLLAKHWGASKEPLRDVGSLSGLKPFPNVEVVPPAAGVPGGVLGITLTDRGGGIGRVVVKVNGKEVAADARRLAADTDPRPDVVRLALPIASDPHLVPGDQNAIEVVAYNNDDTLRSRGGSIVYKAGGVRSDAIPELWGVVVGVSDYNGYKIDLRYAAKDAEAFAGALKIAGGRLLGEGRVHLSVLSTERPDPESRPTKANIARAFGEAAKSARSTDLLVVYLSGHGVSPPGRDEYYYLAADAQNLDLSDDQARLRDTLSGSELSDLIRAIKPNKQVLVLDTCSAGRAFDRLGQRRAVSGDQIRALERVKDRTGVHVLAGAAADAASYEAGRYGQGLLTYSLLLGMTGPGLKDGSEADVLTLFGYAVDQVPQLARGIGGVQRPLLSSPQGASFPFGRLTPEDRAKIPLPLARPMVLRSAFQEDESFDDVLGLGRRVDEALREVSSRGEAAPIFVDASEGADAYRLAGRYHFEGDSVLVEVNLLRGPERVTRISLRGLKADPEGLVKKLVADVEKRLTP